MKIKLNILEKIFKNATGKEIDFLVYASRFQNCSGVVRGIVPKQVCDAIKIHRNYFNHILHSLEDKGIICVDWSNEHTKYWNFTINDNMFLDKADYGKGYINLNTKFFYNDEFINLKKAEKIIMMLFLKQNRAEHRSMTFTFKKMAEWTDSKVFSVKEYVKHLKATFFYDDMTITDQKIVIHTKGSKALLVFDRMMDEADVYNEHILDTILVENKAEVDEGNKRSVVGMFKQFAKSGLDVITDAILACIKNQGRIIAPYINAMIQKLTLARQEAIDLIKWRMANNENSIFM